VVVAVAAVLIPTQLVLVELAAVALVEEVLEFLVFPAQQTQEVVAVVAVLVVLAVAQAGQVWLLCLTLEHNNLVAAQLHQAVATLFTHLHQAGL
jgi:hypothetical protein